MRTEVGNLLTAYLSGWKTLGDCVEWLAGVDWDDPMLDAESRDLLGGLELLSTEIVEGFRTEDEFKQEAFQIVANATGMLYVGPTSVTGFRTASSSTDDVPGVVELTVTLAEGLPSWNISLLPVSV